MKINMVVDSSVIQELEHENEILSVKFKNGKIYRYDKVPRSVMIELMKADSAGGFYANNIKGKYEIAKEKTEEK